MTTAIEKELIKATKLKNLKGPRQKTLKTIVTSALELEGDDWESLSEPSQYFVNAGSRAIEEKIEIPEPNDDFNSDDEYFEEAAGEEESGDDDDAEVGDGDSDADDDRDGDGDDTSDEDGETTDEDNEDGETEESDEATGDTEEEDEDVKPKRGRRKAADDEEEEEEEKPTKKAAAKKPELKAVKSKPVAKAKAKDEKPAKKPTGPKPTGDGAQAWIKRLVIEDTTRTTEQLLALLAKKGHTPTKLATSTIRSGMLQSLRLLKEMGKLKGVQI